MVLLNPHRQNDATAFEFDAGDLVAPNEGEIRDYRRMAAEDRNAVIPVMADSSCIMFFGERGSGKSAMLAVEGKAAAMMGKRVWYWPPSYDFKYGEPIDLETLVALPDWLHTGYLLLDEVQILASNMRSMSTGNQAIGAILQQIRKRGLDVAGSSNQPGRIDQTIALQTDFHYHCFKMTDPKCLAKGKHGPSCDDHVRMRWVDTNGHFGTSPHHKDGRKRGIAVAWKIRDVYNSYNTKALASFGDVLALTKDAIIEKMNEAKGGGAGVSQDKLQNILRGWVPWYIENYGVTEVTAAAIAAALEEHEGLKVGPRAVGQAFAAIGLPSVRTNRGRMVQLPPAEYIATWKATGSWPRE
jgi:hypothetical protein